MKRFLTVLLALLTIGVGTSHASLEDYFVDTKWLIDNRDQALVLDVRRAPLYWLGHIDGAQHVGRDQFLSTRNEVKSLVPDFADIAVLLGNLGATQKTPIVVYAEDNNPYAARLVWTLHYHGHTNAFVLDGGYEKWSKEGHPTSLLSSAKPEPVEYRVVELTSYPDIRAEADYIRTRIDHPYTVIWDTRRTAEFVGTEVRANRGGHIPGAVHLDWTELQKDVDGVKVLRSRDEIINLLNERGLTPDREIVAHCQTGIRSAYATLVLMGLGYERIKNYDGSWIEWANNPTLPIISADGTLDGTLQHRSLAATGLQNR
ncbi:MAG: sulfurtransferase [Desulfuromonadales bacterium]|nr:sulfurtransferase [Desulfuromonadales bacterium]